MPITLQEQGGRKQMGCVNREFRFDRKMGGAYGQ